MMSNFIVKEASQQDALAIAHLHALSWRNTYRNILSDAFLDSDLESERKKFWSDNFKTQTPQEFVLVAELDKKIVGFIAMKKPEYGYEAFIDNLHVHPDMKGQGVGKGLMKAMAEKLLQSRIKTAYLWVLDGNTKAEEFYKRRGATPADRAIEQFGNERVSQTRFVWSSLDELIR